MPWGNHSLGAPPCATCDLSVKMPSTQLEVVYRASYQAIQVFNKHGLACCLVGSAAAYLWLNGTVKAPRTPNDVDLVVMTTDVDVEELKRLLVAEDGYPFSLQDAFDSTKDYKIVWYRHDHDLPDSKRSPLLKVDILVPGNLNIPLIPYEAFEHLALELPCGTFVLPCMPLFPLVVLKLQGWCAIQNPKRKKDLGRLLSLAVSLRLNASLAEQLPEDFINSARHMASLYTMAFPNTGQQWAALGLSP